MLLLPILESKFGQLVDLLGSQKIRKVVQNFTNLGNFFFMALLAVGYIFNFVKSLLKQWLILNPEPFFQFHVQNASSEQISIVRAGLQISAQFQGNQRSGLIDHLEEVILPQRADTFTVVIQDFADHEPFNQA